MKKLLLATACAAAFAAPAQAFETFSAGGMHADGVPWSTLTMDECEKRVDARLAPRGLELSRVETWSMCDRLVRGLFIQTTARPRTGTPDGDYVNKCEEEFWRRSPQAYSRNATIKGVEQNCIQKLQGRKADQSCKQWWSEHQQIPAAPTSPPCLTPASVANNQGCINQVRSGAMTETCKQWWLTEAKTVLSTP